MRNANGSSDGIEGKVKREESSRFVPELCVKECLFCSLYLDCILYCNFQECMAYCSRG